MAQVCHIIYQKFFFEIEVTETNQGSLSNSTSKTRDDNKLGYLIECDAEYPLNIHEKLKISHFAERRKQSK